MDQIMESRCKWIYSKMPDFIDRDLAIDNFFMQEISKSRPNFMTKEGRQLIEYQMKIYRPDVFIIDPLYATHPGIKENESDVMTLAFTYIMDLGIKFHADPILIHHFGKGHTTRGSSVFQGWGEADITVDYHNNDKNVMKMEMLLRCAQNSGPFYMQKTDNNNPWFERIMNDEEIEPDKNNRNKKYDDEIVRTLLISKTSDILPSMKMNDLKEFVQKSLKCAKATAYRLIKEAEKNQKIMISAGFVSPI
jgi:hypothetical protein